MCRFFFFINFLSYFFLGLFFLFFFVCLYLCVLLSVYFCFSFFTCKFDCLVFLPVCFSVEYFTCLHHCGLHLRGSLSVWLTLFIIIFFCWFIIFCISLSVYSYVCCVKTTADIQEISKSVLYHDTVSRLKTFGIDESSPLNKA